MSETPSTVIEPFSHAVAQDLGRRLDPDASVVDRGDPPDRVDVPLDEVPAEWVARAGCSLEVDLVLGREPAEGRSVERLGDGGHREAPVRDRGRGQARAADRDRVADAELRGGRRSVDLEPQALGLLLASKRRARARGRFP